MSRRKPLIIFLVPFPEGVAASQRMRIEQFLPDLEAAGFRWKTLSFLSRKGWRVLYQQGKILEQIVSFLSGYLRRIVHLFQMLPADFVFVQRESSPLGPPLLLWIVAKIFRKRIMYDFDDAVWVPVRIGERRWVNWFKAHWKVHYIIRWAHKVSVGNRYLEEHARQFNPAVVRIPTVVDMEGRYHRMKEHTDLPVPVVGWIGSHSTLVYLKEILPILQRLEEERHFNFLVIADRNPELPLRGFQFQPWSADTEVDGILRMDIGVMPMFTDAWSEGKCGFKLIQYLAVGVPALGAPIGVNKEIIRPGVNGYLCGNNHEWETRLRELLDDWQLRSRMGSAGKEYMERSFSVASQRSAFLSLFS
jgi:glycosyltransferase involved in cell wall biosynthesis